jgi:hypothetical protein
MEKSATRRAIMRQTWKKMRCNRYNIERLFYIAASGGHGGAG